MRSIAILLLLTTAALAQSPEADQRKLRALDTITAQRNQAMDAVAVCIGEYQAQVESLKRELEQAKAELASQKNPPAKSQ